MKNQITPNIQQQMWMGMLYVVRDMPDTELIEYIALHNTPEGKLSIDFGRSIYLETYRQMLARLQSALETEFGQSAT